MDFSFVVIAHNSARYIATCVESIDAALQDMSAQGELFVVDNGSTDGTGDLVAAYEPKSDLTIHLTRFEHNTGTTFSRNQGLKRVTGQHVVVLDSDAFVNSEALTGLRDYLISNPDCGMTIPLLTYPDGRPQLSVDIFPSLQRKVHRFFFLRNIEDRWSPPEQNEDVDYAISAFWMMPLHVVREVGLMDEKIFYTPEDTDYCIRVWKEGYRIHYMPQYSLVHDAQEISRAKGLKLNFFTFSHTKGLIYLYWKHKFLFSGRKFRDYYKPERAVSAASPEPQPRAQATG